MHNEGKPATPALKTWLQHYRAPPRGQDFHERKRAELVARVVARKARVNDLIDLRVRALKASAQKWPPPRCHPHNKENVYRAEEKTREEEKRRAASKAKARAAADVRVAVLMRLRAAGGNGQRKYYC